ncbi:MAG: U32 family peptidase [Pelosinus sp.]|nr:U32 family peptidase [Pelosinus sp.]
MLLHKKSVELLAPVGTWETLEAAVESGADAVYLGGKRFNMRLHRTNVNFDDAALKKAVEYTHKHGVALHITVNNLLSEQELDGTREYLKYLEEIQPDALIVQDLAILELIKEMNLSLPLHASIMMNTHNVKAIKTLQEYGIRRVVANRELTLTQLSLLKERTGIEVEYFIHGDMCISHSGQCLHSGVVFGQSSNRGRCLKPCRWPYELIDIHSKQALGTEQGSYKMALKDMCMYLNLPELIQAGVSSFKIEGRMRTADFVRKIVTIYRNAIDCYTSDPTGYQVNMADWESLNENRARDFSTCYALGHPGASAIGYTGKREPRFFSQAVREPEITFPAQINEVQTVSAHVPKLSVRVADEASLHSALQNGAKIVYIGGEAFKPHTPWTLTQISKAIEEAKKLDAELIITTPRITMERELGELEQLFTKLNTMRPAGIMVSNLGALRLAKELTDLPLHTDFSFNIFNHMSVQFLKKHGAVKAVVSPEAAYQQIIELNKQAALPLELIVHGPLEAMVSEHCFLSAAMNTPRGTCQNVCRSHQYALLDAAGEQHAIMTDYFCRSHVLFAKDLCLLPYLKSFSNLAYLRIEAQHYSSEHTGLVAALYRDELEKLKVQGDAYSFDQTLLGKLIKMSPRKLGTGVFHHRISK